MEMFMKFYTSTSPSPCFIFHKHLFNRWYFGTFETVRNNKATPESLRSNLGQDRDSWLIRSFCTTIEWFLSLFLSQSGTIERHLNPFTPIWDKTIQWLLIPSEPVWHDEIESEPFSTNQNHRDSPEPFQKGDTMCTVVSKWVKINARRIILSWDFIWESNVREMESFNEVNIGKCEVF